MKIWRQLRWRIVAANMAVIVVGVTLVIFMAFLLTNGYVPASVETAVSDLVRPDPGNAEQTVETVLNTFRSSVLTAVFVAGLGALVVGLAGSLWLARQILRPLYEITRSSRRIAWGHYDERVAVPDSDELADMASNFNQMAEALARVEQQRIALIGNVSHELRTPLSGLEGYLEGLIDGLFPQNEETYAVMFGEVRRMRRLVNDLQALSKVEAGQIALQIETFDVVALVNRLTEQVRPQAEAQCLQVETTATQPQLSVRADRDRTAQVVLNMLSNAVRYTPEGGCVRVRITAVNQAAQIEVVDDGIGIPQEALPYIFERFYRVDSSRARTSGGSGIGLTISRHLAWAMGGDILADSEGKGKGSVFTFTLPLVNEG